MAETEMLATLTFNTLATREMFTERAKGLQLHIERGVVTLRSASRAYGDDIIAIERRPRGVVAPVNTVHRRLLQRLFKAGLTAEQPYFVLEPISGKWVGIAHYPFDHPPQGQLVLAVSNFEPPPVAMEMPLWQRFHRVLSKERRIDESLWQPLYRMILSAVAITARPQRGPIGMQRVTAGKLLGLVRRNAAHLQRLAERQPELARNVAELLTKVGVEAVIPQTLAPVDPERPTARRMRRTWYTNPRFVEPEPAPEPEPVVETVPVEAVPRVPVRLRRRRWPQIAPVELEPEESPK